MLNLETIQAEFFKCYQTIPEVVVRAPGRVNLIGEHTDYNQGWVMPMAINCYVWIAAAKQPTSIVNAYSYNFRESQSFPVGNTLQLHTDRSHLWVEYLAGTAWVLQQQGYIIPGANVWMAGEVPIGAGLSSSAAVEMAIARTFMALTNQPWDGPQMALLGQKAENQWVQVNCGIMDQMISACGKTGHALQIDCRTLQTQNIPLPPELSVIVMDTMTRRELSQSSYNNRRAECEAAARQLSVASLRDLSLAQFQAKASCLPTLLQQRARHVISENERVLEASQAMQYNNAQALGKILDASHESLRIDFEVCNNALNIMVEIARKQEGCYGARMTGAGFGGCAIALVDQTCTSDFVTHVSQEYKAAMHLIPNLYICQAVDGASIVDS